MLLELSILELSMLLTLYTVTVREFKVYYLSMSTKMLPGTDAVTAWVVCYLRCQASSLRAHCNINWLSTNALANSYNYFMALHGELSKYECTIDQSLRVGSSKSTWTFQVGSSRSVVASPLKFSGAVGLIASHFKSTWKVDLTNKSTHSSSEFYGWVLANRTICNIFQ